MTKSAIERVIVIVIFSLNYPKNAKELAQPQNSVAQKKLRTYNETCICMPLKYFFQQTYYQLATLFQRK